MIDSAAFQEHLGTVFTVRHGDLSVPLELANVADRGVSNGMRQFSLFFHGPADPLLGDRIETLEHGTLGPLDLFIVPVIGSNTARAVYEACFSLPA